MRGRKGQVIVPEYVVMFFLVIAGLVAMSVYVQRSRRSRPRDTKLYMMDVATQACADADALATPGWDVHCRDAANFQIDPREAVPVRRMAQEYEPYYAQVESLVDRSADDTKEFQGGTFIRQFTQGTSVSSDSRQLPPEEAN